MKWKSLSVSSQFVPGRESRGAALGSETFLVSVSAPQILPCHCCSLAAVIVKSSSRDSWGQQEHNKGASTMLGSTEMCCAECFHWIYAPVTWLGLLWFLLLGGFLFGFCLSLFKYANILSHSLFYLLGEALPSLVCDSDLKCFYAQMSYSVLMHHYAISYVWTYILAAVHPTYIAPGWKQLFTVSSVGFSCDLL